MRWHVIEPINIIYADMLTPLACFMHCKLFKRFPWFIPSFGRFSLSWLVIPMVSLRSYDFQYISPINILDGFR